MLRLRSDSTLEANCAGGKSKNLEVSTTSPSIVTNNCQENIIEKISIIFWNISGFSNLFCNFFFFFETDVIILCKTRIHGDIVTLPKFLEEYNFIHCPAVK